MAKRQTCHAPPPSCITQPAGASVRLGKSAGEGGGGGGEHARRACTWLRQLCVLSCGNLCGHRAFSTCSSFFRTHTQFYLLARVGTGWLRSGQMSPRMAVVATSVAEVRTPVACQAALCVWLRSANSAWLQQQRRLPCRIIDTDHHREGRGPSRLGRPPPPQNMLRLHTMEVNLLLDAGRRRRAQLHRSAPTAAPGLKLLGASWCSPQATCIHDVRLQVCACACAHVCPHAYHAACMRRAAVCARRPDRLGRPTASIGVRSFPPRAHPRIGHPPPRAHRPSGTSGGAWPA